jgi:hypothetical protein
MRIYIILVHIALGSYLNVQYIVNHCQIQLPNALSSSFPWSLSFSFVVRLHNSNNPLTYNYKRHAKP